MKPAISISVLLIAIFAWNCDKNDNPGGGILSSISIDSPKDGSIITGKTIIVATPSSIAGLNNMEFYIDDKMIGEVQQSPFELEWNASDVENGSYSLYCKAVYIGNNYIMSDTVQVLVQNNLYTINIEEGYLREGDNAIVFLSDVDGNLIAEKSISGYGNIIFDIPDGMEDIPQRVSASILINNGNYIYIYSNLNAKTGFTETRKGSGSNNAEYWEAEFEFQNIPDHTGFNFAAKNGYRFRTYPIESPFFFSFNENQPSAYLQLYYSDQDPKYIWLQNIQEGIQSLDLSVLNNSINTDISYPSDALSAYAYIYGFLNEGEHYEGSFLLDRMDREFMESSSIRLFYPPNIFAEYRTSMYAYDSEDKSSYYYNSVYGEIPSSFDKTDADFDFVSTSPDNFAISLSNNKLDEISSYWRASTDSTRISWRVYSPKNLSSYALPDLPIEFLNAHPSFDNNSFVLNYVDLYDFPQLSNYDEVMETVYHPTLLLYNQINKVRTRSKRYIEGSFSKKGINEMEARDKDEFLIYR